MNAFIYDKIFLFKLMASHAETVDAEKVQHTELCLHKGTTEAVH